MTIDDESKNSPQSQNSKKKTSSDDNDESNNKSDNKKIFNDDEPEDKGLLIAGIAIFVIGGGVVGFLTGSVPMAIMTAFALPLIAFAIHHSRNNTKNAPEKKQVDEKKSSIDELYLYGAQCLIVFTMIGFSGITPITLSFAFLAFAIPQIAYKLKKKLKNNKEMSEQEKTQQDKSLIVLGALACLGLSGIYGIIPFNFALALVGFIAFMTTYLIANRCADMLQKNNLSFGQSLIQTSHQKATLDNNTTVSKNNSDTNKGLGNLKPNRYINFNAIDNHQKNVTQGIQNDNFQTKPSSKTPNKIYDHVEINTINHPKINFLHNKHRNSLKQVITSAPAVPSVSSQTSSPSDNMSHNHINIKPNK